MVVSLVSLTLFKDVWGVFLFLLKKTKVHRYLTVMRLKVVMVVVDKFLKYCITGQKSRGGGYNHVCDI